MENYNNRWDVSSIDYIGAPAYAKLFRNVFIWMALALAVTGLTASYVANYLMMHPDMFSSGLMIGLSGWGYSLLSHYTDFEIPQFLWLE